MYLSEYNKRKIITYGTNKEFELDIINTAKEVNKNRTIYKFHCLDARNKECDVIVEFLQDKPFVFRIEYSLVQFWYFLEDEY